MSKKQFTLDSWLKDKSQKVVTRCGFPVRIVCTDVKRKDYPILALVERDDQEEYQSFTKDGRFSLYNPLHDNFDLFIETADEVCEDEKVRKALIGELNTYFDKDTKIDGFSIERIIDWLEKQKPVEQQMYWTEEEIEPIINDYLCGREHYGGMIGRLCHLKPKQKSVEWSEEDKNFMYDTLSNLTELKDRYGEGYGNVGRCIDWLNGIKQRIKKGE